MSIFMKNTVLCGNCGAEVKIVELTSTNAFGSPDLDLRPPKMKRSTMPLWIQECPKCGYVSSNITEKPKIKSDYLNSWQYINCDGITFKNVLAVRFYRKALLSMLANDKVEAYNSILCSAWNCDDCDDFENAIKCRTYMDEIYMELTENEKEDINFKVRHIDVLRRAKLYNKAIELCDNVFSKDKMILDIINFQKEKSLKEDNGVYTVSDIQNT